MAKDGAAESTSPAEAMSRSMCAGATCPRMVGPTAVLDDDSTWSLNSRRWSAVSSRARATSSSSESAARSPRPARARVGQGLVLRHLRPLLGRHDPAHGGGDPLGRLRALVLRVGHVGRGVRPVPEEGGIDGRRTGAGPLAVHPDDRGVDVEEPVEERAAGVDVAVELLRRERALADVAVPPPLQHPGDPGQRRPQRADRVRQDVAGVRAGVDGEAGARFGVGDPAVGHGAQPSGEFDDGDGAGDAVDSDEGAVGDGAGGVVDAHDAGDTQLAADDHRVADLRAHIDDDGGRGHEQRRPGRIRDRCHQDVPRFEAGEDRTGAARPSPGRWPARDTRAHPSGPDRRPRSSGRPRHAAATPPAAARCRPR